MVCGRTQSPSGKYVLGGVSGVGCGNGVAGRCEGAAAAWREPVQLLREPIVLRDSSHAEGAGGAVCATVVGIARTRWESAWSP